MSDTTANPTRPGGDPTVVTPATGELLPVATAATVLGITSDAIRARIRRGKLQGEKRGGAWFVYVSDADRPDTTAPSHDTIDLGHDTHNDDATTDTTPNTPVATGIVDLAPLADLLAHQQRDFAQQGRELAAVQAAAAVWQERARLLEQRLLAIEAGPVNPQTTPETPTIAPGSPRSDVSEASGIRRLWDWLLGKG